MRPLRHLASACAVLSSALLAMGGTTPTAHADQVRNEQWPLTAFHAADRVWPHSTGKGVVVAVIDKGVRATHQDLTGQLLPGKDYIAPGGNGWTDHDPEGHGTAIASMIAGHGHGPGGRDGVMGLAPGAKILPIAVDLDSTTVGAGEVASAIRFATDHGAKVINMSFGGYAGTPEQQAAVAYAEAHNVVLVAAAGNKGIDVMNWPASYPGVVSVAAVDKNAGLWKESSYGPGLVLAAPGVDLVSATAGNDSQYQTANGTSGAAAFVSAEAALVRAAFPKLTAGQVINRLIRSAANPEGSGHTTHFGYGIIRPDGALTMNIPAGPAQGPLPQTAVSASSTSMGSNSADAKPRQAGASPAVGPTVLEIGAALVLAAGASTLLVVVAHRRRRAT